MNTCSVCGKQSEEVVWMADPYLADIYQVYEYDFWCEDCYETCRLSV